MSEDELQAEWRQIVIKKLDSLEADMKTIKGEVREAMSISKDVNSLKEWVIALDKELQHEKAHKNAIKDQILAEIKEGYTSKEQFEPIKALAWGGVALILVAFLTAVITLVIKSH